MMFSKLFMEKPDSWGLRGDPYLWEDLIIAGKDISMPENKDDVIATFKKLIEKVTEHNYPLENNVYIDKYNHGGMSQGCISKEFWNITALDIVLKKFDDIS
jgi:hypothetical protein